MKNKQHLLSEFTDRITVPNRRAAMTDYLDSDMHSQLLLADTFAKQCNESAKDLLEGDVKPHLDICCCGATFKAILTASPCIHYDGFTLPDDEEATGPQPPGTTTDRTLSDSEYARLSRLSVRRLGDVLFDEFDCCKASFGQVHEADNEAQHDYLNAVLRRFLAAARYAKDIGSESAALWLEAFRLLQPKVELLGNVSVQVDLGLVPDNIDEAYAVAEKAQARLWVDNALRTLKPAKLAKSRRTRR